MVKDKCVCMLCHQTLALSKRGHLERHYNTNHDTFKDSFPAKNAIRAGKVAELKAGVKAATEVSFRISHLLAKHKKPFTYGDLFGEAMAITAETVFNRFKNKDDIKTAFRIVQLGPNTVARRVEEMSGDDLVLKDLSH